jgi:hypothetical protein
MGKLNAYCTSLKCTESAHRINTTQNALKHVGLSATNCPDCGSVLLWKSNARRSRPLSSFKKEPINLKRIYLDNV